MPRFSRKYAPRKTNKHEVSWSNLSQNASAVQTIILAQGIAPADVNTATEVEIGSHVYSLFIEFNLAPEDITSTKIFHWNIQVQPQGLGVNSPGTYYTNQRRFIIQRGMEMLNRNSGSLIKRVFKVRVPRIYQRLGDGTSILLNYVCSSAEIIDFCGIAIYKEIS